MRPSGRFGIFDVAPEVERIHNVWLDEEFSVKKAALGSARSLKVAVKNENGEGDEDGEEEIEEEKDEDQEEEDEDEI
jgi:ribosomal protein L12E/L44/L45/RPP1/RPP2